MRLTLEGAQLHGADLLENLASMRDERGSEQDRTAAVKDSIPWHVVHVQSLADQRLHVEFADGTSGEVNLGPLIRSARAGVLARLRDEALFAAVSIEHGAVSWSGEIDLAPDAMYDAIRETGCWTPGSDTINET